MRYITAMIIMVLMVLTACSANQAQPESNQADSQVQEEKTQAADAPINNNVKTFKITAQDYKFVIDGVDNPEIRVKKGDKVIIELTSIQGSHNWNVNQLAARTKTLMTNESTTLEFTAHTAGTFNYYCAVGIHERRGMKGVFIVEE